MHPLLGEFILSCEGEAALLFTENETNNERLFPGQPNATPYVKDGINDCIVQGKQGAVNPGKQGTKVAAHYRLSGGATPVSHREAASDGPSRGGQERKKQNHRIELWQGVRQCPDYPASRGGRFLPPR